MSGAKRCCCTHSTCDAPSDYLCSDPEECKAKQLHLTSCDDDGYCNYCGYQSDENVVFQKKEST